MTDSTRDAGPTDASSPIADLERRIDRLIADGAFDWACEEAERLIAHAAEIGTDEALARANERHALAQVRRGRTESALQAAVAALEAADRVADAGLTARCLLTKAEVEVRIQRPDAAVDSARRSIELFTSIADTSGAGRSYWILAGAYYRLHQIGDSREAAEQALELCSEAGDHYGMGNALNVLSFTDADLSDKIQHSKQAADAFAAAGYRERSTVVASNLAEAYFELGLYDRARQMSLQALEANRAMRADANVPYTLVNLIDIEIHMGRIEDARTHVADLAAATDSVGDPLPAAFAAAYRGRLAAIDRACHQAIEAFTSALSIAEDAGLANTVVLLTLLAEAHLLCAVPEEALSVANRAIEIHTAQGRGKPDGFTTQEIWWRYAQALAANGKDEEATAALKYAYRVILEGLSRLNDEGLWRNYLNKVPANREIILEWLQTQENGSAARHLEVSTDLHKPIRRLADFTVTLNTAATRDELFDLLVRETMELTGAEHVFLLLESGGTAMVAASLVPAGEAADEVLPHISPVVDRVRDSRIPLLQTASIHDGIDVQSRIVVPLLSRNDLVGYLYADMRAAFGSFTDSDRDVMELVAGHAAAILRCPVER